MAILAECPFCHSKRSMKRKKCSCGADLDQLKRTQKVRYWIDYRDDSGKHRRTPEGFSLEDAKAADGKVRGKKREGSILEITNESRTTYSELIEWYLGLSNVKELVSFERIEDALDNFKNVFGKKYINTVKNADLVEYQRKRMGEGRAKATIDMETTYAKAMIKVAFYNDKVSGRTLKTFNTVERLLPFRGNTRDRKMSVKEYLSLVKVALPHLRDILIVAFNTGMRKGEILNLQWHNIDKITGFIRLSEKETKEKKKKSIPINANVKKVFDKIKKSPDHDHLFTYLGKPIDMGLRNSFKAACEAAGIKFGMKVEGGIRFHDIRGTVKTNMLSAGVDKTTRDALLGHSLEGMDAIYIRVPDDDLRKAMDLYTTWLNKQIKKAKVD